MKIADVPLVAEGVWFGGVVESTRCLAANTQATTKPHMEKMSRKKRIRVLSVTPANFLLDRRVDKERSENMECLDMVSSDAVDILEVGSPVEVVALGSDVVDGMVRGT